MVRSGNTNLANKCIGEARIGRQHCAAYCLLREGLGKAVRHNDTTEVNDCMLFPTKMILSRRPRHRTEQDQTYREHSCRVSKSIEEWRSEHQAH